MNVSPRDVAPPDETTRGWWDRTRARRLAVQRCTACGHRQHHPRAVCTACGGTGLVLDDVAGTGTVYSFTVVHRAPDPALETPYVVALIELDEGVRLLSNLVGADLDGLRCDAPVVVDWVPLDDGRHLPVFRPAAPPVQVPEQRRAPRTPS